MKGIVVARAQDISQGLTIAHVRTARWVSFPLGRERFIMAVDSSIPMAAPVCGATPSTYRREF